MKCIQCGTELPDGTLFCFECGTRQPEMAPEQPAYAAPEQPVYAAASEQPVYAAAPEQPVYAAAPEQPVYGNYEQPAYTAPGQPVYGNYEQPVYAAPPQPAYAAPEQPAAVPYPYVYRLKTNRGLGKFILLTIVTLGIYAVIQISQISVEINMVCSRYDGKKTMHASFASGVPIANWIWQARFCDRIGNELKRRGIDYKFSRKTYWGWGFWGCLILVGPFIYGHKLFKAMNKLNADWNING